MFLTGDKNADLVSIITFTDSVYEAIYSSISAQARKPIVDIDAAKIQVILSELYDFKAPYQPMEEASAFKKSAYFIIAFCKIKPIQTNLPDFGKYNHLDLSKYNSYHNEIIAFEFTRLMLTKSIIYREEENIQINNSIKLSTHSYEDLIQTLSKVDGGNDYVFLSLLIEQMVYRENPEASYDTIV